MTTSLAMVMVVALAVPAPMAQDTQAAERAQVEPVTKKLMDAFRAGDAGGLKDIFADKVLFVGDLNFLGDAKGSRGQREVTRDELTKAYTAFFAAVGKEKWDAAIKQTTNSLVRASQKGGHPDDSKGELPRNFVQLGDYVFQITHPGSGLDDLILFVLRPVGGKWQVVAHWADY